MVEEIRQEDDELYVRHTIVVDGKQEPIRIDKYLHNKIEKISRNKLQLACKSGLVTVNGKPVKSNAKIKPHDEIVIILDKPAPSDLIIKGEAMDLDIVYEDEHIMVINKKAGIVVHPGTGNMTGTLVHGIVHHLAKNDLPVMEGNSADRPGIVHRIDKDTSGLMVIAKTEEAITHLSKQFYDHSIDREYIALVWGDVDELSGRIEGNIGRHPTERMQMFVYDAEEGIGKPAVTHFELMESYYYVSLVKCRLETGRTHQIRVHMKSIGHTLFNDARYGGDRVLKGTVFTKYRLFVENCFSILPRQALHAHTLGFVHPITKEKMRFESPLPEEFTAVVEKWKNYLDSRKTK